MLLHQDLKSRRQGETLKDFREHLSQIFEDGGAGHIA